MIYSNFICSFCKKFKQRAFQIWLKVMDLGICNMQYTLLFHAFFILTDRYQRGKKFQSFFFHWMLQFFPNIYVCIIGNSNSCTIVHIFGLIWEQLDLTDWMSLTKSKRNCLCGSHLHLIRKEGSIIKWDSGVQL